MEKQTLKSVLSQVGAPDMLCATRQWVGAHAKSADALESVNKHATSPIAQMLASDIGFEPLDDCAFLISTLPGASTTQPGLIAYYATEQKMLADIRTPVKVRRYLQKFPTRGQDPKWVERMAKDIDEMLGGKPALDVRLFSSADIDGWRDAYQDNNNIRSCMSQDSIYGVSRYQTYRCYATAHYGLPDNGLTLAALYHKGEYVARAIVFEHDGKKCYIKHYGDSRIADWLNDNGYDQVYGYPDGTTLVAFPSDSGGYYHPYVDGCNYYADLCYNSSAEQHYWMLGSGGRRLDDADGVAYDDDLTTCEHCSDSFDPENEGGWYQNVHGHEYALCSDCYNNHTYEVHNGNTYPERLYVLDLDDLLGTRLFRYQGELYTRAGLADEDLAVTSRGVVDHIDHLWFCSDDEEYHTGESDDGVVDTSDIPEECGWGETHITEDGYKDLGHRLAYRELNQDEFDPDGKPWLYHDDVVVRTSITRTCVHEDDTILERFTTTRGKLVTVILPSPEAAEQYPELAALQKVSYEYLLELGAW
jgi:hypothetical protein